jgi:hypothetical protein
MVFNVEFKNVVRIFQLPILSEMKKKFWLTYRHNNITQKLHTEPA